MNNISQGYVSQAKDTSIEMDFLQFQRWREIPLIKKIQLIIGSTQGCRKLSLIGIKNQYPHASFSQQRYLYAQKILGENWSNLVKNWHIEKEIMIGNPIELALLIAEILETLEIPYLIGGSIASSLWGESRATLDLDLVADLKITQIDSFISKVQSSFCLSKNAIEEAIQYQSFFNLIHFDTNEKIDIFIVNQNPLAQEEMRRKCLLTVDETGRSLYFASAEDIIIQKLIWYKKSNYISERQWRDILGVLKTQSTQLDFDYLNHWSNIEKLSDLLDKAFLESGINSSR